MDGNAQVSQREAGKAGRRRKIVDAAASLLREAGFDGVSMAQIAERAGVAPGTVYNLFETKTAIVQQVFDADLADFERQLSDLAVRDALERIFAAVELAARLYRRDPAFYRAMARARRGADRARIAIAGPRQAFWERQVAAAIDDGGLSPGASAHLVGVALSQLMRGAFLEWAEHAISAEQLAAEVAYGFAMILLAHASKPAAAVLEARMRAAEDQLSQAPHQPGNGSEAALHQEAAQQGAAHEGAC